MKADKRRWLDNIANEAEEAARSQHMKTLYGLTKILCNEKPKHSTAVMDKYGNILSRKKIYPGWTEHFKEVLNRDTPGNPITTADVEELDLGEVIHEIATDEPTIGEVKEAVQILKSGKAPGIDNITAELLKTDIEFSATRIHEVLTKVWRFEAIPDAWRRGLIIKLPKKGNLKDCKNSRGITLLSVVGKILGRIVIDRVRNGTDKRLRKEQAGYRQGRGTTDQVFILRNIIEQVNEWQATLYVNFIDFEKAFDSIHRESPRMIRQTYGISGKIVRIVIFFYECAVEDKGERGEWFKIKTGVKQGYMSGFLLLLVMDWVMRRTVGEGENGIRWKLTSKP